MPFCQSDIFVIIIMICRYPFFQITQSGFSAGNLHKSLQLRLRAGRAGKYPVASFLYHHSSADYIIKTEFFNRYHKFCFPGLSGKDTLQAAEPKKLFYRFFYPGGWSGSINLSHFIADPVTSIGYTEGYP